MENKQYIQEDEVDLRQYIEVILKRKILILLIFVIAVISAYAISSFSPKVYRATASINIILSHESLLTSNEVLQRVIQKLELKDPTGMAIVSEDILKSLSIKKAAGTNAVQLFAIDPRPEVAGKIVNAWAQEYVNYSQQLMMEEIKGKGDFIASQFEFSRKNLLQAEEKVNNFNRENKLDLMKTELSRKKSALGGYKNELAGMELALKTKEDFLNELKKQIATKEKFINVASNTDKGASKSEIVNFVYQNLEENIVNTEVDINTRKPRLEYLNKAVESITKECKELDNDIIQKEFDLAQLTRDVDIFRKTYNNLSDKIEATRLVKMAQFGDVRIVSYAIVPNYPEGQGKTKTIAFAGISSLIVGVFLAFCMEFWQKRRAVG